jgi:DNA repair exonuclease SbcCD ATPase subunit
MEALQNLSGKLDLLLKKYAELQAENKRLKKTISEQLKSIEQLNKKFDSLEENMVAIQLGKNFLDNNDKLSMTKQIDTVIGEIDKILVTLND